MSRLDVAGVVLVLVLGTSIAAAGSGADAVLVAFVVLVFAAAARTRRRFASIESNESSFVLPLVLLPTLVGIALFTATGAALAMSVLVMLALALGRRGTARIAHPLVVAALVVAIVLPASRSLSTTKVQWWHVAAFLVVLVCVLRFPFRAVVMSVLDGVGLYLVANVVAYFIGVTSPAATLRTFSLDSSTGGVRVFFPLSSSLAVPPLMAAMFVAAGLICFEGQALLRAFRVLAFVAGSFIMIEANTRAALVVAAAVLLASVVTPRILARFALPIAVVPMAVAFLYPVIATSVVQPIVKFVAGVAPVLSRGDVSSDVALEGRSRIWSGALEFWHTNVDFGNRLFGFGEFGQQRSGASAEFAHGNTLLLSFSTHNSTLQQLFDGGLVGVVALVIAALGATRVLKNGAMRSSGAHLIGLAALLACLLGGGTEVTQAPGYGAETFWVFCALVLAAAVAPHSSESEGTQPRERAASAGM